MKRAKNMAIDTPESNLDLRHYTDEDLIAMLSMLAKGLAVFEGELGIPQADVEYIYRQYLAFDWLMRTERLLKKELKHIRELKKAMKVSAPQRLGFIDIPRPPVFCPEGSLHSKLPHIVANIIRQPAFDETMAQRMGLKPT